MEFWSIGTIGQFGLSWVCLSFLSLSFRTHKTPFFLFAFLFFFFSLSLFLLRLLFLFVRPVARRLKAGESCKVEPRMESMEGSLEGFLPPSESVVQGTNKRESLIIGKRLLGSQDGYVAFF